MADASEFTNRTAPMPGMEEHFTPAYLEGRRRALAKLPGPEGLNEPGPAGPAGHEYAIRKSTWLTSEFRRHYGEGAMDVTPQDVIDALVAGEVKDWVLMGLHGYVGYMP